MMRVVLGVITLVPWVYLLALLGFLQSPATYTWLLDQRHIVMFLTGVLWISYMTHSVLSPRVPRGERTHWFVKLLFGNFVMFPIYFWRFVWRPHQASKVELL
jgi:hypothetical protein